jgi:starch synthase
MRIVFVAAEVFPFAKTGGLADVCGTLPLELERMGHDVSVIMPGYRSAGVTRPFSDRARMVRIGENVRIYFLTSARYYDRPGIYADPSGVGDYPDNIDRFAFLCHEALRLMKDLGSTVDIIHCHDWQSALVPVLLKNNYRDDPFFAKTRTVLTVHNLAYQGVFPGEDFARLGIDRGLFTAEALEFYGKVNLLKGGLVFADRITTVSPQYAHEIQTVEWGCGLDGVVRANAARLTGILNGLDYKAWDPGADEFIDPPYSASDLESRVIHKRRLQELCGLPVISDIPVFGFVGRLCYQKGFDLLARAFEGMVSRPLQMVFVGVGEARYREILEKLARKAPRRCGFMNLYDEHLAHQVYAGSDFFLMPSVYEPCGLTQMIALRYGSLPLVTATGGLIDTITDLGSAQKKGNGIVLLSYTDEGLLEAVDRASILYYQKDRREQLMRYGMSYRWTWETAARHYIECYRSCSRSA